MIGIEDAPIDAQCKQMLLEAKEIITSSLPGCTVLLFGSVARGTQDPESDYDILILSDRKLTYPEQNAIRGKVFDFELEHNAVFSMLFMSREQWESSQRRNAPFYFNVQRDAVEL